MSAGVWRNRDNHIYIYQTNIKCTRFSWDTLEEAMKAYKKNQNDHRLMSEEDNFIFVIPKELMK